jgi:hypothetical protein
MYKYKYIIIPNHATVVINTPDYQTAKLCLTILMYNNETFRVYVMRFDKLK